MNQFQKKEAVEPAKVTQESYDKMSPAEKTQFLGYKIFTPEEIADRSAAQIERCTKAFKFILKSISDNENLKVGTKVTDEDLAVSYKDVVNNFYQYGLENNLTGNDFKELSNMISQIATIVITRTLTQSTVEMMRSNFALLGENELYDVPIKKLSDMATAANESKG